MRTRTILGFAAPALLLVGTAAPVEADDINSSHAALAASVRRWEINHVKVHFDECAGMTVIAERAIRTAHAPIQGKDLDTGIKHRDEHLRAARSSATLP